MNAYFNLLSGFGDFIEVSKLNLCFKIMLLWYGLFKSISQNVAEEQCALF